MPRELFGYNGNMSWASRRRFLYLAGVIAFFAIPAMIALTLWLYEAPTCFDGKMNQGETKIDRGGPCRLLDENRLVPHSVLWARTFFVRHGVHSAVAYIENPNPNAGVREAPYRFRLYDARNILVAELEGVTPIMPGTITPVFEGAVETGDRVATRAFFEFSAPLVWERLVDQSRAVLITDKDLRDEETAPRATALVKNGDVNDIRNVVIAASVFDTAGNAFAASSTILPLLAAGETVQVSFTWPKAFERRVARVEILPVVTPVP